MNARNREKSMRSAAVFFVAGTIIMNLTVTATSRPARVICGGGFAMLPTGLHPNGPDGTEHQFVYAESCRHVPLVMGLSASLILDPPDARARVRTSDESWCDLFSLSIEKDGSPTDAYSLELIPKSHYAIRRAARIVPREASQPIPDEICAGESVRCFWRVAAPEGTEIAPGLYRVVVEIRPDAEAFFGLPVGVGRGLDLVVKRRQPGDDDRYTEDLIERHYLWGCQLYEFDKAASKEEFEKAWKLVQEYLRRGAGDEPDLFNITPRYQASLIAGWLDKRKREIAYLSKLLSKHAGAVNAGTDCKMRYYHFHRERGHLPRSIRDDLGLKLNRLYERVYGRTMSGQPLPTMPPMRKNLPDTEN